jgi:predicted transcriptional regulator
MPTGATVTLSIRLYPSDLQLLDQVAEKLHSARPGAVAIAIRHLAVSLARGDPIYVTPSAIGGSAPSQAEP